MCNKDVYPGVRIKKKESRVEVALTFALIADMEKANLLIRKEIERISGSHNLTDHETKNKD